MKIDTRKISLKNSNTIKEALRLLDETAQGILFLVDSNNNLTRTITDGDLRRLILAGKTLDSSLEALPSNPPIVAPIDISNADAANIMHSSNVDKLPLIDDTGKLAGLLRLSDITPPILLSTPHMGDQEKDFVNQAFDTNWIAPLGPNVDAFEKELADIVGVGHASAVSSGTAAIHLALVLLGVQHNDLVYCSSFTFVASANPILYLGAKPVFIDSEPDSWNMSPEALERALLEAEASENLPRAVIVVNLYGQSADMDKILNICNRYQVPVVEDAAESLGATYKNRNSGTLGKIGVFSFNGNKIITTSGGGMLVSEDEELIDRSRFLATQARDQSPYYLHSQMGYNYRMSNVLAGIGRGQLRVLNERIEARRDIFNRYYEGLKDISSLSFMPEASFGKSNRWLTCAVIEEENPINPTLLIDKLKAKQIEARHLWRPMHKQPLFNEYNYYEHKPEVSVSDNLFEHGICLPSGSNLSINDQERVIEAIISIFNEIR